MPRSPLFSLAALLAASALSPASAQIDRVNRSAPTAAPIVDTVPTARDIPWPGGTMKVEVDATDLDRRIVNVTQTIPLAGGGGPLTLLFPEWLPGNHAPRGPIDKIAGIAFKVDGKPVAWLRDTLDVYAFHLSLPENARTLVATFQFLAPTTAAQGRVNITDKMMNLQFEALSMYPAGYYTRRVPVQASVTFPAGWEAATAMRGTKAGARIDYAATDYETLIDSPIFAGPYMKRFDLGHDVTLNVMADTPAELAATPEQIGFHKKLVDEALALFGAKHFDHYDFLFAITDEMGGIGLEHHRSSENGVGPGYFTKWNDGPGRRNLLPHEFTHSWDGKFRRGATLWTPDFRTPMQNETLWVYEGQTQFWGYILGNRSGITSKPQTLDALASIAARLDLTKGREWRPMVDTTNDPIISARRPKAWTSWQRSEDYYNEGLMIWLEADAIIQKASGGSKGLDDFAKAFFGKTNGLKEGDWGQVTFTRQDVIDTLNAISPYDWTGFFATRVDQPTKEVTKAGFDMGGYRLVYDETPNTTVKDSESSAKSIDMSFGPGMIVKNDGGEVTSVIWGSAAFKAGMAIGNRILAVNGDEYSADVLKNALTAAKDKKNPVTLILKQDKRYRTITLDYSGGIRYPHLRKQGEGEGSLDRLLRARTTG
ncbi:M61 family metallopeptidase [Sphingobium sp. CR28]|uniref:M61 family metallopeptidase n=1 Tax=Sphingobium sp. CR28 TaxID=3400272 RepID=UPI003FED6EF4